LHELWNARYITNNPARIVDSANHIDLMLIKKVDEKIIYKKNKH